ncbi:MAG TPA: pyridoxine 5'-phosphate synthase [Longimicrobiales bacterium]|nr:pyridoxine 5'-phosphate synthase [Longimicrobiales bacterium]
MRLHINVDHVATIRQARRTDEPDPVRAAVLAELGGADGITVHLREDRRHIQDRDVRLLLATVRTGVNLELAAASDVLDIAVELRPMAATLVPERREEITTEGGLDLSNPAARDRVGAAVRTLRTAGIRTSLFIAPESEAIRIAADLGADAVELHTGEYAGAWMRRIPAPRADRVGGPAHGEVEIGGDPDRLADPLLAELGRLRRAAALASSLGLAVHAGHGLTYENVLPVVRVPEIEELNIGHSVISRAVFTGMEAAVREMRTLVWHGRQSLHDTAEA